MATRFILVRHGQTDWNIENRFRGRGDVPLNQVGEMQAKAAAAYIAANFQPVAIFSGALARTRQTAEAIGLSVGFEVQIDDALLDLNCGEFSGLTPAEAEVRCPNAYRTWLSAPHVVRFPGGEALADVNTRVTAFAGRLMERYPGQQVVLVTHMDVIRVLLCALLRVQLGRFKSFQIDPASVSVADVVAGMTAIVALNDRCHLQQIGPDSVPPRLTKLDTDAV